jgi:hypothetical protein
MSGQELAAMGYEQDAALASELDVSDCVPELLDGLYYRRR